MEITQVRVFPVDEDKLKAFASIIFDDCFVVSDIKIIHGNNGMFISMPSKKRRNGTFRDIAHPLNNETRQMIEEKILGRYEEMMREGAQGEAASGEREPLEEEPPLTESTRDILGP
jgi:stage V sporulation protein G